MAKKCVFFAHIELEHPVLMYSINSTELNRNNRNRKFLQSKSKMYFLQQGFNLVLTNFNSFVPCFSEIWIQLFWVESFQNFATNFTFEWLPSCDMFNIRFYLFLSWNCFVVKLASQILHLKGFFPSWIDAMCPLKLVFRAKIASQTVHLKDFVPPWIESFEL